MNQWISLEGVVTNLAPMQTAANADSACTLMLTILGHNREIYQVTLASNTFVLNQEPIQRGDTVTVFYDSLAPTPLIYPPQYQAAALAKTREGEHATLDYFDQNLLNSGKTLQLNRSAATDIRLPNGQPYLGHPGGHLLLVLYTTTTRSIPPQTTPAQVVVFCSNQ